MEPYDVVIDEGVSERYTLLKKLSGQWAPILIEGQPIPFRSIEQAKEYARITFPYAVEDGRIAVARLWTETVITHRIEMLNPVVVTTKLRSSRSWKSEEEEQ